VAFGVQLQGFLGVSLAKVLGQRLVAHFLEQPLLKEGHGLELLQGLLPIDAASSPLEGPSGSIPGWTCFAPARQRLESPKWKVLEANALTLPAPHH
jgi:hypothetical protein